MSDDTKFAPCPFCGEAMTKAHAPDCYFEVRKSYNHEAVVKAWNRRTPIAAVGGDLPPPDGVCNSALRAEPAGQQDADNGGIGE